MLVITGWRLLSSAIFFFKKLFYLLSCSISMRQQRSSSIQSSDELQLLSSWMFKESRRGRRGPSEFIELLAAYIPDNKSNHISNKSYHHTELSYTQSEEERCYSINVSESLFAFCQLGNQCCLGNAFIGNTQFNNFFAVLVAIAYFSIFIFDSFIEHCYTFSIKTFFVLIAQCWCIFALQFIVVVYVFVQARCAIISEWLGGFIVRKSTSWRFRDIRACIIPVSAPDGLNITVEFRFGAKRFFSFPLLPQTSSLLAPKILRTQSAQALLVFLILLRVESQYQSYKQDDQTFTHHFRNRIQEAEFTNILLLNILNQNYISITYLCLINAHLQLISIFNIQDQNRILITHYKLTIMNQPLELALLAHIFLLFILIRHQEQEMYQSSFELFIDLIICFVLKVSPFPSLIILIASTKQQNYLINIFQWNQIKRRQSLTHEQHGNEDESSLS